jgi:hypothetical protein
MLFSLSFAQPVIFCNDTLICTDLPANIKMFLKKNLPEYKYPNVDTYLNSEICSHRKLLSKNKNQWPPFFIQGDFNRDGIKDYVIIMSKITRKDSNDTVFSGYFIILHGTKDGFVIADTEDAWSSSKGGWFSPSCQIAFIKKGNYKLLNGEGKQITIKIPYDGFMVYGEDDVIYYYWENGKYLNKKIYSFD